MVRLSPPFRNGASILVGDGFHIATRLAARWLMMQVETGCGADEPANKQARLWVAPLRLQWRRPQKHRLNGYGYLASCPQCRWVEKLVVNPKTSKEEMAAALEAARAAAVYQGCR